MAKTIFKPVDYALSQLVGDIELGKLALPELQRPFVWPKTKVRDLLDSMYRGFPIGYLMLWSAAEADSKSIGAGGKQHTARELIVDGQQRLTSLYAVTKGVDITFKDFSRGPISIGFRPRDERFEVTDAAIEKDPEYLPSITSLWAGADWEVINAFIERLREAKPEMLEDGRERQLRDALGRLKALEDFPFQAVQIGHEINEEQVAEIFLRVNSGGTSLTQADFILTMLSVFREADRQRLESFSRAAGQVPSNSLASPHNHLIVPAADQLLRVAVLVAFQRGRLQSVLPLLRGSSMDGDSTLAAEEREKQLDKLTAAIEVTLDLTSWHEYIKALMSAGFRRSNEISSENNVLLVYALYLIGRSYGLSHSALRTTIARFFFMSSLTARYTGSFETQITQDVQAFTQAADGVAYLARLRETIATTLTPDYWAITLPRALASAAARGPGLFGYAASLCLLDARVPPFVKRDSGHEQKAALSIRDLFDPVVKPKKAPVDRHHLFPRRYLQRQGISEQRDINQIANMAYVEWPENIEISDTAPSVYWPLYADQFSAEDRFHHALPDGWEQMGYEQFLKERRELMAQVIREGFETIGASPGARDSTGSDHSSPAVLPGANLQPTASPQTSA
ncbi:MAG: GmrSD restriction endonuclease domain-containing protein [Solirubrobacteraceae bacterium]